MEIVPNFRRFSRRIVDLGALVGMIAFASHETMRGGRPGAGRPNRAAADGVSYDVRSAGVTSPPRVESPRPAVSVGALSLTIRSIVIVDRGVDPRGGPAWGRRGRRMSRSRHSRGGGGNPSTGSGAEPIRPRCDQSVFLDPKGRGPMGMASSGRSGTLGPFSKGLILAQNERWRRGLGMQVARARPPGRASGARVSKATATHPTAGYSRGKPRVIPGDAARRHRRAAKAPAPWDGPSWY